MSLTPILTYHKIAPVPPGTAFPGTYVPPRVFAAHVAFLARRYRFETVAGYLDDRETPGRVVLTFDDGTADFAANADPVLARHEAGATVFLVTAERANRWDARPQEDGGAGDVEVPLLTPAEIRALAPRYEFGSHTRTHPDLAILEESALHDEISLSRDEVTALASRPCRTFCYPYGRKREAAIEAVRAAGYDGAVSTEKGGNRRDTDPFLLRRVAVRHDTPLPVLVYKLWRARRLGR